MRRWIWPLSVALMLIAAAWAITKNHAPPEQQAVTDTSLPSVTTPGPEIPPAAGTSEPVSKDSTPRLAELKDEDFVDRQEAVPGKLSDVLSELVPRAEAGDAQAAYQLFVKINDCKGALEGAPLAQPTTDQAAQAVQKAWLTDTLRKLENCEGLTDELIGSRAKWLTMAADNGDPLAQLTYAASSDLIVGDASQMLANPRAVEDYKAKSLRFLTALADRGDVSAILQLSTAYRVGVLVPQDRVRAYAYAYLANLIAGASTDIIHTIGATLTNEQRLEGERLAISLHRRCCG